MKSLSRSELRSIIGGNMEEPGGNCGKCNNPQGGGTTGCYKQSGGPLDGQCRCMYQQQTCA